MLLLSNAGCRDGERPGNARPTTPPEEGALRIQPGPTQPQPVPIPSQPRPTQPQPGDPQHPTYVASQPLRDARDHVAMAVLALLRAHARLTALDAAKYALWISETDARIRRLLPMLCADRIAPAGVDLDHTAIERLFPMEHVESAASITCIGLRLADRTVESDLWARAPRGRSGAAPIESVDAGPTQP